MNIQMPPKWFNPHGLKMALQRDKLPLVLSLNKNTIQMGSNTASLQISTGSERGMYRIYWQIVFHTGIPKYNHVKGEIEMSEAGLRDAFALSPNRVPVKTFSQEYGADTASPGIYIRKGQFLNIPMPGTGTDGDPNISVFVSDEIKEAVLELINSQQ